MEFMFTLFVVGCALFVIYVFQSPSEEGFDKLAVLFITVALIIVLLVAAKMGLFTYLFK